MDAAVDSLTLWWREAGLHTPTMDGPRNWRDDPLTAPKAVPMTPPQSAPPRHDMTGPAPLAAPAAMPEDLPAFLAWLTENPQQPEAGWPGDAILPDARTDAPLLVLTDMAAPDAAQSNLFSEASGQLLAAMLRAIGRSGEDVAFAPLFIRRAPGGLVDDAALAVAGERSRHYLALARPRALLILGDRASRALGTAAGDNQGDNLRSVHHRGGTIPAIAVPQLELMMRRPQAKAQSWRALRHIAGVLA